ncbi:MAG TPA: ribosomal protein L7/L12 [Planctomycetota bacterium]|nr:ribosomal protein L7/L12 [Planctomycetota bacterium]
MTKLERYEAVLKSFDAAKKDQTLFTIKNNTGLSEEAVTKLMAAPPGTIKKGLTKAEADRLKASLTAINAEVEVKESGK